MKVILVSNRKGGVGKSTISLNLAQTLSKRGYKTLLIDADAQANASATLGFDTMAEGMNGLHSLIDVLINGNRLTVSDFQACLYKPTYTKKRRISGTIQWEEVEESYLFDLLPTTDDLSSSTIDMIVNSNNMSVDFMFKILTAIAKLLLKKVGISIPKSFLYDEDVFHAMQGVGNKLGTYFRQITAMAEKIGYDFTIIDSPPAGDIILTNALMTDNCGVIIPIDNEPNSVRNISKMIKMIHDCRDTVLKANGNHYGVLGLVLNKFQPNRTSDRVVDEFLKTMPLNFFDTKIRDSSSVSNSSHEAKLVVDVNPLLKEDFNNLVNELLEVYKKEDSK